MALNPFFLQGSPNEQFLIQDLINEQLRMYGIEVYYLPRKIFKTDNIIREAQSSKFDDSFILEAYLGNYEGYNPGYDVMSKFGLTLKNEISLIISKERFEEFISPFLEAIISGIEDGKISKNEYSKNVDINVSLEFSNRPKEGDLIYFPLGERLFEIKRVESERPFYQLGKNYVYELSCELYEFENELIDTSVEEVDNTVDSEGYITTLNLVGIAKSAEASAILSSGYIKEIFLNNDGKGYSRTPTVTIGPPPDGGVTATAVATTKNVGGIRSIDKILLTNSGSGYITPPKIIISGGGGTGAAATCSIGLVGDIGVSRVVINDQGNGYTSPPSITVSAPSGIGNTAILQSFIDSNSGISSIRIINSGSGYSSPPSINFSSLPSTGIGTYFYNETIIGNDSGTVAVVRNFTKRFDKNLTNPPVELEVSINTGKFFPGEIVVGTISSARYIVQSYDTYSNDTTYEQNKQIEIEADSIIDFSESNPFGEY